MEHPYEEGTNVCINGQGHMTKMAAMAINSKNLNLHNQKAYDFETWHETSGNGALQSLYVTSDRITGCLRRFGIYLTRDIFKCARLCASKLLYHPAHTPQCYSRFENYTFLKQVYYIDKLLTL